MSTIGDTPFSATIYGHAIDWTLLLHQLSGVSIVIPLPDARLLSFIQIFQSMNECRNCITENHGKNITLYAYDGNMQQLLASNIDAPPNVKYIKIFYQLVDHYYVTRWVEYYRRRFQNVLFEIITIEELSNNILSFGLEHIRKLRKKFKDDFGILNRLDQDYKEICRTLGNHARHRA
jgi:hypothetical protein